MSNFELNPEQLQIVVTYATRVAGALVLLIVAFIVAAWVRRLVARSLEKTKVDATLTKFFSNAARYLVLIMAILAALGIFGIETTSFAAVLGAAGLAIGLAFQGSLSNFAAGVMLLVFRPFKVGDVVKTSGETGKIDEIELFTTKMITPDNRLIIHPNSKVFGSTIENVTFFETRRVNVDVGVDYSADMEKTREILEAAAKAAEPKIEEPASAVVLTGLGASSVDWTVRVWCNTPDFWALKENLTFQVKKHLDDAGIGIPFPQQDVHFDENVVQAISKKSA